MPSATGYISLPTVTRPPAGWRCWLTSISILHVRSRTCSQLAEIYNNLSRKLQDKYTHTEVVTGIPTNIQLTRGVRTERHLSDDTTTKIAFSVNGCSLFDIALSGIKDFKRFSQRLIFSASLSAYASSYSISTKGNQIILRACIRLNTVEKAI